MGSHRKVALETDTLTSSSRWADAECELPGQKLVSFAHTGKFLCCTCTLPIWLRCRSAAEKSLISPTEHCSLCGTSRSRRQSHLPYSPLVVPGKCLHLQSYNSYQRHKRGEDKVVKSESGSAVAENSSIRFCRSSRLSDRQAIFEMISSWLNLQRSTGRKWIRTNCASTRPRVPLRSLLSNSQNLPSYDSNVSR